MQDVKHKGRAVSAVFRLNTRECRMHWSITLSQRLVQFGCTFESRRIREFSVAAHSSSAHLLLLLCDARVVDPRKRCIDFVYIRVGSRLYRRYYHRLASERMKRPLHLLRAFSRSADA